jgi:hypothetical protein
MKQLWERFGDFMGAAHPPKSNGRVIFEHLVIAYFGLCMGYFAL